MYSGLLGKNTDPPVGSKLMYFTNTMLLLKPMWTLTDGAVVGHGFHV